MEGISSFLFGVFLLTGPHLAAGASSKQEVCLSAQRHGRREKAGLSAAERTPAEGISSFYVEWFCITLR
jgi:hypothetical protein